MAMEMWDDRPKTAARLGFYGRLTPIGVLNQNPVSFVGGVSSLQVYIGTTKLAVAREVVQRTPIEGLYVREGALC